MTSQSRRKTIDAPPWMHWLLTPLLARVTARAMVADNPGVSAAELAARMRADLGERPDPKGLRLVAAVERQLGVATRLDARAQRSRLPSALVLVLANLVPLYGVVALDWEVYPLILLFWVENVLVGMFNALRMLSIDPRDPALWLGKLLLVPFFCLHYGFFTAIHASFVFGMFGGPGVGGSGLAPVGAWLQTVGDLGLWLSVAALAASHLFSFGWNYLGRGEYRLASILDLMVQPYRRVLVLHLTIILGGMAVAAFGSPLWALLVLIAVKVGLDLRAHLHEHR